MVRITQFFKETSKNAQYMHYDLKHAHGTVYSRYGRPSAAKIDSWNKIISDYEENYGLVEVMFRGKIHHWQYNFDIEVAGASSHFYSTVATFKDVDDDQWYIVKETHANTYACQL